MTDERLEQALRLSGEQHLRRPLPPALRDRLLGAASRPRGARAARRMLTTLAVANVLIAAVAVAGGLGSRGSSEPRAGGGAAAAATPVAPSRTALDQALIDGRRIVLDALQEEGAACRQAAPDALPADLVRCRGSAVLVAQAAAGFSARLQALPSGDVVTGVDALLNTLADLRSHARRLAADVDARAAAAISDDSSWVAGLAWAANMALVFEPFAQP